jgi:putative ABC transport system permease protein
VIVDLWESFREAVEGLSANKLRAGLTMLGVVIGVTAVITLLSIGQGVQASITASIAGAGSNLITVFPGSFNQGGVRSASGSAISLTYADAEALADPAQVPDAIVVAPQFGGSAQAVFGNINTNARVTGITSAYEDAFRLGTERGRFVDESDVAAKTMVAVLGHQIALDLFGGFDPVGQLVKVTPSGSGGTRFSLTVIGVLASKGRSAFNNVDDSLLVPISTAQTKLFKGRNALGELMVNSVTVEAASAERTDAAIAAITNVLRARHNLTPDQDADFQVLSQTEMLASAQQVTNILVIFLGAVAAISLLVGGIGIMNIMLVSVTERTREIGLRKAVGARPVDILRQFLLEAIVLSLTGGLVGIAVGAGLARVVSLTGFTQTVVTFQATALAVGFSLAVGLFFGIYPANRAARLRPIEALRYE